MAFGILGSGLPDRYSEPPILPEFGDSNIQISHNEQVTDLFDCRVYAEFIECIEHISNSPSTSINSFYPKFPKPQIKRVADLWYPMISSIRTFITLPSYDNYTHITIRATCSWMITIMWNQIHFYCNEYVVNNILHHWFTANCWCFPTLCESFQESRKERQRRIDAGDETARLK